MKKILLLILGIILVLQPVLGAHFIIGYVDDAYDGESANTKTIVLWNPLNGITDNQTDIIGITGNSGSSNTFMIDCEILNTPCQVNDILNVQVVNQGDNYTSQIIQVTVTGSGFDDAGRFRLNSPPRPQLVSPADNYNTTGIINFNCSWIDNDTNVETVSLFGNWTGTWQLNESKSVSIGETSKLFTKQIETEESYKWTCFAEDNLTTGKFAQENRTFTVDNTPPVISSVQTNQTDFCGAEQIRVNCTVTDSTLEIDTVIIQRIAPNETTTNFTASLLTGDTYYRNIEVNDIGDWQFTCIANDTAGNNVNLTSNFVTGYSAQADLILTPSQIFFNTTPIVEFESINITANIINQGCSDATNIEVGFYKGNKDSGGESLQNNTISVTQKSSLNTSISWSTDIGISNMFIYSDINNDIIEFNESNNNANKSIYLTAWQEIYGNTTVDKKLTPNANNNLSDWIQETNVAGNVFIVDTESNIDWYNLEAIGRDTSKSQTADDFSNLDTSLGMVNYNDSIYNSFTNSGTPKETKNFTLFQYTIENVSTINSTNTNNFKTGILWDKSDDTGDNEYDTTDKEDIVFITEINKQTLGKYGTYDYEIRIPAKLREYYNADTADVYYYYEIN